MAAEKEGSKGPQKYKVRLLSGREVGPLDLESVLKLVRRGHIQGSEAARRHPAGEWQSIRQIEEIASLLPSAESSGSAATEALPSGDGSLIDSEADSEEKTYVGPVESPSGAEEASEDATYVGELPGSEPASVADSRGAGPVQIVSVPEVPSAPVAVPEDMRAGGRASEATVVFSKDDLKREGIELPENHEHGVPIGPKGDGKRQQKARRILVLGGAVIVLGVLALMQPEPKAPAPLAWEPVRPKIPQTVSASKADSAKSRDSYVRGMQDYAKDDIVSYRKAAGLFIKAAESDPSNDAAIAMLAATYLNLIDVSLKDDSYFQVITSLLDRARSSGARSVEVLIAEVEYFKALRKPEAALKRVEDFLAIDRNKSRIMDVIPLIADARLERGEFLEAAKALSYIADNTVHSPRVFFVRGQVAERLGQLDIAEQEYLKAIGKSADHAMSRLRLADLLVKTGKHNDAAVHLKTLVARPQLLPRSEMARAFYLSSVVKKLEGNLNPALESIKTAIRLDPDSRIYRLEFYTQKAQTGKLTPRLERESRMYFLLIDAERLIKERRHREALVKLLAARAEMPDSIEPLIELGDLFTYLNDVASARYNYEKAAKLEPKNLKVWSKFINSLIQSYDWPEAEKAIAGFRRIPEAGSSVDKVVGDMYAMRERYEEALGFYKSALSRDSIDPEVYLALAKLLMKLRKYHEAPLFYSLALRVDPLNVEAEVGIARAVAELDGIPAARELLQKKLAKAARAAAPFEAALAELAIREREWEQAREHILQAQAIDPEYAYPSKLLGQLYENLIGIEKDALDRALDAYQSYSDRNPSDPSGYIDAFRLLAGRGDFPKAQQALDKVVRLYPKYPRYHYFKGQLYAKQGNHRDAVKEFNMELENNPSAVPVLLTLGESFIALGDFKAASARFSEAMQLDASSAKAKMLAGYAAYLQGNHTAAIALYRASAGQDPNNPMVHRRLGDAYRALGSIDLARQSYRKYLEQEPDSPDRAELSRY